MGLKDFMTVNFDSSFFRGWTFAFWYEPNGHELWYASVWALG